MVNNTSQLYPPAITDDPAAASSLQSEVNLKSSLKEKWNLKGSYFSYFLAFNFYYMGLSLFSALISVYLIGLGFSAGQASLVVSVSFLASMAVQPFIGTMADHYGSKQVSVWLFMGASLGGIVFLFCRSLWMLMAFYSLVMVLLNGANPIIEKMATNSPYAYGKIRIWGSLGAALGTQLAGYLYDRVSPSSIFIAFVVSMLIGLYGTRLTADMDLNDSSKQMDPANTPKTKPGMLSLLGNRKYLYYLVVYGLFMGVTAAGNTFIPSLFTSLGLPASMASLVLSLAIMTQLPLVLYAGKFMNRMTNKALLSAAFGVSLFQNLVYGLNLPLAGIVGVAILSKTIGIMLMIMTNLKVISSIVPASSQMSALALAASVNYLASIAFNNATGVMIDHLGYQPAFMMLAIVMVSALVLVFFFKVPAGTDQELFS